MAGPIRAGAKAVAAPARRAMMASFIVMDMVCRGCCFTQFYNIGIVLYAGRDSSFGGCVVLFDSKIRDRYVNTYAG